MILVKYECGCIGFPPDGHINGPVIIQPCDLDPSENNPLGLERRKGVDSKKFEDLNGLAQGEYERKLEALIRDGYALRSLRQALGLCGIDVTIGKLKDAVDLLERTGGG